MNRLLPLLAAVSLSVCLPCQAAPPAAAAAKPAWPKLDRLQADRVEQLLGNLKLKNPELHEQSLQEMVAVGAGAAPALLARLSDAKGNQNAWIGRALDGVTTAEHAPLLAAEATSKVAARRCWSVGRLAELAPKETAAVFRNAMADKDPEVAFRGALGLAGLGDAAGLPAVHARAKADWNGSRAWIEKVLPKGRGDALSAWLAEKATAGEFADKVAALRLFRSGGTKAHARQVAAALDASDHGVKKEAINALRVVVLGEPPLEDLSVFQAIEMAKEIRSKL